ncbi:MAG: FecR domain-containing protein [Patescibacteria group bacterium]
MKKLLVFLILILAILAGGGYWFWSLGRIPAEVPRTAALNIESQGVQIRRTRDAGWEQANSGMQIYEGWSVKTDENGRATIRFYDQGETRLSQNTEIVVDKASFEMSGAGRMIVSVKLQTGRVWSRILKLLDIGSSYDVRTTNIVATVRGTSFDLSKNADGSSDILVGESAVTVANLGGKTVTSVAEGIVASFNASGALVHQEFASSATQNQWIMSNELADSAFVDTEKKIQRDQLQALGGPGPDSNLYAITQLSERVHLALAKGAEKDALAEQYAARKIFHLIELVESGKTGLAAQEFSKLDASVKALPTGSAGEAERVHLANALSRIHFLVQDANPSDAMYPFKQRVENLVSELAASDPASSFYVRMLAFDARLDEASNAITNRSFDEARIGLDGVRDGIENIRRESAPIFPSLPEERRSALEDKLAALDARTVMMRMRLDLAMREPQGGSSTSTMPGITNPPDGALTPDAPNASSSALSGFSNAQTGNTPAFTSIEISLASHTLDIGKLVSIKAKGILADGTKTDITNLTQFAIDHPDIAVVNGPTVKGLRIGNGVITATYNDGGTQRTATSNVVVQGKIVPVELILKSMSGSTIATSTTSLLSATLRYNTDELKNVTANTNFTIVEGGGSISNGAFTASNEPGATSITGSTVENGVTIIGTMKIIVK